MLATFAELLNAAATLHANEIQLRRGEDGAAPGGGAQVVAAQVVAMVRGDAVVMAELTESEAATFLAQAFSACDGAQAFQPGVARMMRLTGERLALPRGLSQVLMQFLPAGGARALVGRIAYDGDVCCGSCGGGG